MKKISKKIKALSIVIASILISFSMTGCFFGGGFYGFDEPMGYYQLFEVTVFNNAGFELEHWHWSDFDFYDEWGDSFLYFDSWDYIIDIFFDDLDWYHSYLNGSWFFDMWYDGDMFYYIDIFFDWGTDFVARDYEFIWCAWYDEVIVTYFGLFRIYEFVFIGV